MRLSTLDRKILNCIQEDIPLEREPFRVLSQRVGIKEERLIKRIKHLKDKGFIRRFSASLDHRKLKFRSTLLGLKVPGDKIESIARDITGYPEVTHCYLRNGAYNLWAVFLYQDGRLRKLLNTLEREIGRENILNLVTKRQFKLKARIRL
ncbi:MAG: Lrp/AsnC family transcriptional regulator [Candidatus Omnitrophota bacterium]